MLTNSNESTILYTTCYNVPLFECGTERTAYEELRDGASSDVWGQIGATFIELVGCCDLQLDAFGSSRCGGVSLFASMHGWAFIMLELLAHTVIFICFCGWLSFAWGATEVSALFLPVAGSPMQALLSGGCASLFFPTPGDIVFVETLTGPGGTH